MTRACSVCSVQNPPRLLRGLCRACYSHMRYRGALADYERATRPWAELVDDISVLLVRTNDPGVICASLRMTPKAIAEAAYRNGRLDLARPFWAHERATRRAAS